MSINTLQDQIIEEFELFDSWEDRYAYLIELGKKLPSLEDDYKTEDNKIKGCQSNVWVHAALTDDKLILFRGDSDALIVKGLVSILIRVLSEQKPSEIANADLYFLEKIGMQQHLSMTRANGLLSMIKQMKMYGLVYQSKLADENN